MVSFPLVFLRWNQILHQLSVSWPVIWTPGISHLLSLSCDSCSLVTLKSTIHFHYSTSSSFSTWWFLLNIYWMNLRINSFIAFHSINIERRGEKNTFFVHYYLSSVSKTTIFFFARPLLLLLFLLFLLLFPLFLRIILKSRVTNGFSWRISSQQVSLHAHRNFQIDYSLCCWWQSMAQLAASWLEHGQTTVV